MSFPITYNGVVYVIPEKGDNDWGPDVTSYLNALSVGSVTKAGGLFPLLADLDFGATYGVTAGKFTSMVFTQPAPAVAISGALRLRNAESISWRNSGNTVDLGLSVNASNQLIFNGNPIGGTPVVAWGSITGSLSNQTDLQTALNLKANLASPTFTGTVSGITKSMVGLANVDNTADTAKPVSTAQQTALDLKANVASPVFTGTGYMFANAAFPVSFIPSIPLSDTSGTVPINRGGTGQITQIAAFTALAPTTTKGDIIVTNNAGNNIRLSVGANGYVLTSDSSAAGGVSWQASSGGGTVVQDYTNSFLFMG